MTTPESPWLAKRRAFVADLIRATKLTKKERQLALWLLVDCDEQGYVLASPRDLFLQVTGTEPGQNDYVQVNYHTVFQALSALCKAGVLAFTWNQNLQGDIAMAFMRFPKGAVQTWDG